MEQLPAWYQTIAFRLLVVAAILASLSLGYRLRVRQLKASERRLQATVDAQTRELSAKNAELERALEAVREASRTDPLTGLRNRRYLREALATDTALVLERYRETATRITRSRSRPPSETSHS